MRMLRSSALTVGLLALNSAAFANDPAQDAFWNALAEHCGERFAGELTLFDEEADAGWLDSELVMHIAHCGPDEIRIPLRVGEDNSRTWILRRLEDGLELKHRHMHGEHEDKVSWYGGRTTDSGRANRQTFPVDAYSRALFLREGLDASVGNLWSMEIWNQTFAYELVREGRVFRAEFDLAAPLQAQPATVKLENLLTSDLGRVENTEVIVSRVTIPPDSSLPRHWHPGEEFAYVLDGRVTLWQAGKADIVSGPGEVVKIPLEQVHTAMTGPEGTTVLVFRVHEKGRPERIAVD